MESIDNIDDMILKAQNILNNTMEKVKEEKSDISDKLKKLCEKYELDNSDIDFENLDVNDAREKISEKFLDCPSALANLNGANAELEAIIDSQRFNPYADAKLGIETFIKRTYNSILEKLKKVNEEIEESINKLNKDIEGLDSRINDAKSESDRKFYQSEKYRYEVYLVEKKAMFVNIVERIKSILKSKNKIFEKFSDNGVEIDDPFKTSEDLGVKLKLEEPVQEEVKPEVPVQEEIKPEVPVQEEVKPEVPAQEEVKPEVPAQEEIKPENPDHEEEEPQYLTLSDDEKIEYLNKLKDERDEYKRKNADKSWVLDTDTLAIATKYTSDLYNSGKLKGNVDRDFLQQTLSTQERVVRSELLGVANNGKPMSSVTQKTKNMLADSFREILSPRKDVSSWPVKSFKDDDEQLRTLIDELYGGERYNINILDKKMSNEAMEKVKILIEATNQKRAELSKAVSDKNKFDSLSSERKEEIVRLERAIEDIDKYLIAPINVKRAQEELKKSRGIFGRFFRFDKNIEELARTSKEDFVPYDSSVIDDYKEERTSSLSEALQKDVYGPIAFVDGEVIEAEVIDKRKDVLTK